MKYYAVKVIYVVFCLIFSPTYVKVEGELACSQKLRGIVGGKTSFTCVSATAISYLAMSKPEGLTKFSVVTVGPDNQLIFYDSNVTNYKPRVKISAEMKKGFVSITFLFTVARDSGLYEFSYKTKQHAIIDQKSYANLTFLNPPTSSGSGWRNSTTPSRDTPFICTTKTDHSKGSSSCKVRFEASVLPMVAVLVGTLLQQL